MVCHSSMREEMQLFYIQVAAVHYMQPTQDFVGVGSGLLAAPLRPGRGVSSISEAVALSGGLCMAPPSQWSQRGVSQTTPKEQRRRFLQHQA